MTNNCPNVCVHKRQGRQKLTDRLAEDDVAAVLHGEAHGDGGGAVLHQQKHHGLLGFVAHQRHTVGQRGEERVQSVAPLTCTHTHTHTHTHVYMRKE